MDPKLLLEAILADNKTEWDELKEIWEKLGFKAKE